METKLNIEELKAGKSNIRRFLFLFSLPFLAIGLGVGYFFFSKVFGPEGFSSNLFPILVLAVVFTGAGVFLMFKVPKLIDGAVHHIEKRQDARQSGEIFEPWMENPEWAKGKIECSNQGAMWGVGIFAVIWSAISIPASFEPAAEVMRGEYGSIFILFFPLIGVLLLILAVWMTLRWRKFGGSTFELSNRTGYVGGELKGTIRTSNQVAATGDFSLKLKCLEKITTGSGKNRSTSTTTVWEQEKKIPGGGANSRMGIPVMFSIPDTCLETDDESATGTITWNLAIHAPVAGVDYSADFTVPVFKRRA